MIRFVDSNRWTRALGGLAVIALVATATAVAQQSPPDGDQPEFVKESFQWFEAAGAGETARVSNPHGSVFARFGGYGDQFEILATRQRLDGGAALEVERRRVDGGLEVVVVDPERTEGDRRDRIDLVLFVPLGVTLDVSTVDGSMEIKKLKSDLVARSVTGDIYIRGVKGRVDASSERGDLEITLATGATDRNQRLSTVTGEIMVHLWEDAKHVARLATSGEISTDFSLTIEHRRFEEPGKYAVATINGGGPTLELASKRGRLRLLRLPKNFRPTDPSDTKKKGAR